MSNSSVLGGGDGMTRCELTVLLQEYVDATWWKNGCIQIEPEVCEVILRNLGGFAEARFRTTTTTFHFLHLRLLASHNLTICVKQWSIDSESTTLPRTGKLRIRLM